MNRIADVGQGRAHPLRCALAWVCAGLGLLMAAGMVQAKATPVEAAQLGNELTPVGAVKAGNRDGTIPEWTPLKSTGSHKPAYPADPALDGERPLFTITAANLPRYADKLTEGHKHLLRKYPSYKMKVYPSHRTVAWPEFIYKSTVANALRCELRGTDDPVGCELGFPFPVPQSGAEVLWNHKLKYRGTGGRRYNNQMIVQPTGDFQLTKIVEEGNFYYSDATNAVPMQGANELLLKYFSLTQYPPRLAGTMILVHERAGTGGGGRQAWIYAPALKRIRRAPTVCCDNPAEGTDGHQFYDQIDMFNGVLERFTWKLVGKKEMYIPYNSNRIAGRSIRYRDMAAPRHLNQDLPRYELHRVWIVEAELRAGTSHTFAKRRFYVDEDGWQIVVVDNYDNRGQLYQVQEGHMVAMANLPGTGTLPEVIYHLTSGRYFITALANEDRPPDYGEHFDESRFEPRTVQMQAGK